MFLERAFATMLALLAATAVAGAQTPSNISGSWHASIELAGLPQPVTLRIGELVPGKRALELEYAAPRRCKINGEYGGLLQGNHFFYLNKGCINQARSLRDAMTLRARLSGSGDLIYEVLSANQNVLENAIAKPAR